MDEEGRGFATFHATLVTEDRVLFLPASMLKEAARISLRSAAGQELELTQIIAADHRRGVVVFASGVRKGSYLELEQDEHPLFLGRELSYLTRQGDISGWVDGPHMQLTETPVTVIPVRLSQTPRTASGMLLDPETHHILGMILDRLGSKHRFSAVDASALRDLLDGIADSQPKSIEVFYREYFLSSPPGLWVRIQRSMEAGEYASAIEHAERLLEMELGYRERLAPLLETAAGELVADHLVRDEHRDALGWLERTMGSTGENGALYRLHADVYQSLGDYGQARLSLQRAGELEPSLIGEVNRRIRELTLAEVGELERDLALDEIIWLLEAAVQTDLDYAPYHRYLGHYYLQQRAYAKAMDSLRTAQTLDESLTDALAPWIEQARIGLANPQRIEVPFQAGSGVIYVSVQINRHPSPFRVVLDTGASHTTISSRLAASLGIAVPSDAPRLWVRTANRRVAASLVTLESVDLGGAVVEQVPALVLETLDGIDGLLGLSFLRHFNVEIHQQERLITLGPK